MKKILSLVVGLALLAGAFVGARTLDRMALGYLKGPRGVAWEGQLREELEKSGPVPGWAFLGFSRPSEDPPGLRVVRPFESGREIGLSPGDVVTSVDGQVFRSTRELMLYFIRNYVAGDSVMLRVSGSDGTRELRLTLRPFVRHPGDLGLPYEEVELQSDSGHLLKGWFIPPPENSDGRVGVFVHGAASSRIQALEQGGKFWRHRGYGLLTMDLSGRGASEGEYITYTINERHDVASMVRYLRERQDIDPSKIVVFGTSNGAAAVIFAAADDPNFPPVALDAPYSDLWSAAGDMLQSRGASALLRYPLSVAVRMRAGIDLSSVRPGDVITSVKAPVFFVHGDQDEQVPPYHSETMHQARLSQGMLSERWLMPGGEHGFDNYPPQGIFWNRILDFFDSALGGPPEGWEVD